MLRSKFLHSLINILTFLFISDGDLISQKPRVSMRAGASRDYDLLTGYTRHDMAFLVFVNPLGFPYLDELINLAGTQVNNENDKSFILPNVVLSCSCL